MLSNLKKANVVQAHFKGLHTPKNFEKMRFLFFAYSKSIRS